MVKAIENTFKAWRDEMPGSGHKLIVTGEVECPTTGWKVGLSEARPQGINPAILILQVDATRPTGHVAEHVTNVPVRFEKSPGSAYDEVTIRGGGPEFTIAIQVVH